MKILVVDDDPKVVAVVTAYLKRAHYELITAVNGQDALDLVVASFPDLVILDLKLPDISGLEVARNIRQHSEIPIIMLTAKASEDDVVKGLQSGADDYVTKPFSPRILVARVASILRRCYEVSADWDVDVAGLQVNYQSQQVLVKRVPVKLTKTEFELLAVMSKQPNQIFTREQLIEVTRGFDYDGLDRVIDSHIKNLRRKIEVDPKNPQYIKTANGSGYFFKCDYV